MRLGISSMVRRGALLAPKMPRHARPQSQPSNSLETLERKKLVVVREQTFSGINAQDCSLGRVSVLKIFFGFCPREIFCPHGIYFPKHPSSGQCTNTVLLYILWSEIQCAVYISSLTMLLSGQFCRIIDGNKSTYQNIQFPLLCHRESTLLHMNLSCISVLVNK